MLRYNTILKRHPKNPIISPMDFPYGPADQVFNPGQCMYKGKTLLILSVKLRNKPYARAHVATSDNGIDFEIREKPLFQVDFDKRFGELDMHPIDCRVTRMGDTYYIIRPGNSEWGCISMLYRTRDFETVEPVDIVALPHNRVPSLFPEKIIGTMQSYLLTPDTEYEHHGVIPNVVFTTGAIADLESRRLRVYYGGADTCVCLAEGDLDEIIDACIKGL